MKNTKVLEGVDDYWWSMPMTGFRVGEDFRETYSFEAND